MKVDHAFIVNLRYAFQDDENCFFVLDLMLGGDLRCAFIFASAFLRLLLHDTKSRCQVHLERMGSFSEDAVRVYVAELGSALSFLHEKKIIHR